MSVDRLDDYIEGLDNKYIDRILASCDDEQEEADESEIYEREALKERKSSLIEIYEMLDDMVNNIETEIDRVIESEHNNKRVNHVEAEELIEISNLISKITKKIK